MFDSIARNLKPGAAPRCSSSASIMTFSMVTCAQPDFIQTYIFPGGCLLDEPRFEALAHKTAACRGRGPRGLPPHYAETLKRWRERYNRGHVRCAHGFAEPFHDLWRYYLMYCEGGFRGGAIDVAQVTMIKS